MLTVLINHFLFIFLNMKKWLQKNIVYLIALIILVTLFIQVYWNLNNYEANRVNVNNEVQAALNTSIDTYYTNLAKTDIKSSMTHESITTGQELPKNVQSAIDSILITVDMPEGILGTGPAGGAGEIAHITDLNDTVVHIVPGLSDKTKKTQMSKSASATVTLGTNDSIQGITTLATKVIISLSLDKINFKQLTAYLNDELTRKGFDFKYALSHKQKYQKTENYNNPNDPDFKLSVESASAYLPSGSNLKMYYPNINSIALKQGLAGIILSFMFTIAIITSLLYLLRMIKEQKQIVLSKNDFISNISHELKTPIATSLSALEAIRHFNENNDPVKTDKYMGIASQQLEKLNVMVEKILDTASLDSHELALKKESTDVVALLKNSVEKHQLNTFKHIKLVTTLHTLPATVDLFHFENVINNIIENAIKYGGNSIIVTLTARLKQVEIAIADDGQPIDKSHRAKIFDKFYRVSTQNRHDVKGYGIGLYYAKSIIEKHGGKLILADDPGHTVFKITLPYV